MKDILKLEDDELSLALGEILQPEKHGHIVGQSIEEMEFSYYHCKACGKINFETDSHCPLAHLIPLDDWGVAMKHFRAMSDEYTEDLIPAMVTVFLSEIDDDIIIADAIANLPDNEVRANADAWFSHCAQPKHYLQAAAKCKTNAEGEEK